MAESSPPPPDPGLGSDTPPATGRPIPPGWWVGLAGLLVGIGGLLAAFWALQDRPDESAPVTVQTAGPSSAALPAAGSQGGAPAYASGQDGTSQLLEFEVPTGFPPPQLQSLNFAESFAQAAAYRGWQCQKTEVILFSDAAQAIPAVQEQLMNLGYQVTPTDAALGEDESWLARSEDRPTLFGSYSRGESGRGNVSLCQL